MVEIPKFVLYGQNEPSVEDDIQPSLALRQWGDLPMGEKEVALQEIRNKNWLDIYSRELLQTIEYLNYCYLRQCPGKRLHQIQPVIDQRGYGNNDSERMEAARLDFQDIFLHEKSDALVLRMLSKFAQTYIDGYKYNLALKSEDRQEREGYIAEAFQKFDRLANCFNHIFEQFSVNQLLTRSGFVPRQDGRITNLIYIPTLKALADPRWKTVSDDLAGAFEDYQKENYPESITKAHSAVQRFLQVLVGEEGKSGKGEVGKLFAKAKQDGAIPLNRFTEPLITVLQGFIPSERATNSTAKPALKKASASDALLMMNIVMVFLQHCLQKK